MTMKTNKNKLVFLLLLSTSFFSCKEKTPDLDGLYVVSKVVYHQEIISLAHLFPINTMRLENGKVKEIPIIGKSNCGSNCDVTWADDSIYISCQNGCWLAGKYQFSQIIDKSQNTIILTDSINGKTLLLNRLAD